MPGCGTNSNENNPTRGTDLCLLCRGKQHRRRMGGHLQKQMLLLRLPRGVHESRSGYNNETNPRFERRDSSQGSGNKNNDQRGGARRQGKGGHLSPTPTTKKDKSELAGRPHLPHTEGEGGTSRPPALRQGHYAGL